jgi:hypothetical protein
MKTTPAATARRRYEAAHAEHVEATLDDFAAPCPERVASTRAAMEAAWTSYLAVRRTACGW